MEPLTGPGLAPLEIGPAPPPDRDAEPAGFVVAADDGTRIHFLDWRAGTPGAALPSGAPRVLLLHGLASTAWTWAPVARRLASRAHVVVMDLRGHGLSDAPTDGYDAGTLIADAVAVAEGAGLLAAAGDPPGGPLVLAGIGYGAIVAAWTARALGDRCAGLVLVDGGWEDVAATTAATLDEWLAAIDEPPEVLASMAAWLGDRAAFDPSSWDADEERATRAQVVETAAGRVKLAVHPHAMAGSVRAMWSYDPAAVLLAVDAPIVALVARDEGSVRFDALRAVAHARHAAGGSPVRVRTFPERGHNLARYEPGAVAAAVLAVAGGATMRP